ncbi:hypothetical protein [Nocardioides campestrisoli]|uniref:hypothetical protein n=1 Tax=Nocardioides campestrisoli TaxID=2736757 RepID=UPI00163D8901|nr:hypothetical protein [Nocardioides campestrisoli]
MSAVAPANAVSILKEDLLSTVRVLCLFLMGLLLAPLPPASSSTATGRTTSSIAVTVANGTVKIDGSACRPIRYSVAPGLLPDGGSYDVRATLRNKQGRRFGTDRSWLEEGASYRGSIAPRCGRKLASGTYTISVKVVVNDYYLSPVETRSGATSVRLKVTFPATTALVVQKSPYGPRGWQWTGRLTSGGKPVSGQRIELWWDLPGWADYDVPKRTNHKGIAHWVSNPNGALGGINFRLRFRGAKGYAPSDSAIFNVSPR